jgi:hypothetical protein
MQRSAGQLRDMIPESVLEVKEGLYHGEFSLNHPEQYAAEIREMINRR